MTASSQSPPNDSHSEHRPEFTGRRAFLRFAMHGLSAILAAAIGAPVVAYLIDPRNRKARESGFRDIARVDQLPLGEPMEFVIRETVRDAWVLRPNVIVGRVFLIRRGEPTRENVNVDAFTTICPHMGCSFNYTGNREGISFLCPCHQGRFDINGARIDPNHNAAPRDMDQLRVQWKDPNNRQIVQVEYKDFRTNQTAKEEVT